jgi:hypothetical protein
MSSLAAHPSGRRGSAEDTVTRGAFRGMLCLTLMMLTLLGALIFAGSAYALGTEGETANTPGNAEAPQVPQPVSEETPAATTQPAAEPAQPAAPVEETQKAAAPVEETQEAVAQPVEETPKAVPPPVGEENAQAHTPLVPEEKTAPITKEETQQAGSLAPAASEEVKPPPASNPTTPPAALAPALAQAETPGAGIGVLVSPTFGEPPEISVTATVAADEAQARRAAAQRSACELSLGCGEAVLAAQDSVSAAPAGYTAATASFITTSATVAGGGPGGGAGGSGGGSAVGGRPQSPAPTPPPSGASGGAPAGGSAASTSVFLTLAGLLLLAAPLAMRRLRLLCRPWLTAFFVLIPERPG